MPRSHRPPIHRRAPPIPAQIIDRCPNRLLRRGIEREAGAARRGGGRADAGLRARSGSACRAPWISATALGGGVKLRRAAMEAVLCGLA